jgi:hypothetical protein
VRALEDRGVDGAAKRKYLRENQKQCDETKFADCERESTLESLRRAAGARDMKMRGEAKEEILNSGTDAEEKNHNFN